MEGIQNKELYAELVKIIEAWKNDRLIDVFKDCKPTISQVDNQEVIFWFECRAYKYCEFQQITIELTNQYHTTTLGNMPLSKNPAADLNQLRDFLTILDEQLHIKIQERLEHCSDYDANKNISPFTI